MRLNKKSKRALKALNFDLFVEGLRHRGINGLKGKSLLPDESGLMRMYERLNYRYFRGKLPRVKIEWSNRMLSAGQYYTGYKLIRLGRKYHEYYPEDVEDTLKHEMIHILYPNHGKEFKREAARIKTSLHAKDYPGAKSHFKYVYICPACGQKYFRRRRMSMASCGECSGGKYNGMFKLKLHWSAKSTQRKK